MDKKAELIDMVGEYEDCEKCPMLCGETRKNVVFGAGNIDADIMLIGDAPRQEDDSLGLPMVGTVGTYLNGVLLDAGIVRNNLKSDVYVTNTVLCRPTIAEEGTKGTYYKNREPRKDEIDACTDRLFREIYLVDPKVIVLMGKSAASFVTRGALSKVSGNTFYLEVPGRISGNVLRYFTIVTWNPAYIMQGNTEPLMGTEAYYFYKHFKLASKIVKASQLMSQEVNNG